MVKISIISDIIINKIMMIINNHQHRASMSRFLSPKNRSLPQRNKFSRNILGICNKFELGKRLLPDNLFSIKMVKNKSRSLSNVNIAWKSSTCYSKGFIQIHSQKEKCTQNDIQNHLVALNSDILMLTLFYISEYN